MYYVDVYVHICAHMHVYICVYVCMYACMHMSVSIHRKNTRTHTLTFFCWYALCRLNTCKECLD